MAFFFYESVRSKVKHPVYMFLRDRQSNRSVCADNGHGLIRIRGSRRAHVPAAAIDHHAIGPSSIGRVVPRSGYRATHVTARCRNCEGRKFNGRRRIETETRPASRGRPRDRNRLRRLGATPSRASGTERDPFALRVQPSVAASAREELRRFARALACPQKLTRSSKHTLKWEPRFRRPKRSRMQRRVDPLELMRGDALQKKKKKPETGEIYAFARFIFFFLCELCLRNVDRPCASAYLL